MPYVWFSFCQCMHCPWAYVMHTHIIPSFMRWCRPYTRFSELANDHCQFETFNATCRPNEAIILTSARYGRMQMGRCVTGNYGYIGCSADVSQTLEVRCSGRQRCHFGVSTLRETVHPCPVDLTAYLHTVHHCVRGKFLSVTNALQCKSVGNVFWCDVLFMLQCTIYLVEEITRVCCNVKWLCLEL